MLHIWGYRNKAVFEGFMTSLASHFNKFFVDHSATNFILHRGKRNLEVAPPKKVWEPPRPGFLKLNTNGCWKSNDKLGGWCVSKGGWFVDDGVLS